MENLATAQKLLTRVQPLYDFNILGEIKIARGSSLTEEEKKSLKQGKLVAKHKGNGIYKIFKIFDKQLLSVIIE